MGSSFAKRAENWGKTDAQLRMERECKRAQKKFETEMRRKERAALKKNSKKSGWWPF